MTLFFEFLTYQDLKISSSTSNVGDSCHFLSLETFCLWAIPLLVGPSENLAIYLLLMREIFVKDQYLFFSEKNMKTFIGSVSPWFISHNGNRNVVIWAPLFQFFRCVRRHKTNENIFLWWRLRQHWTAPILPCFRLSNWTFSRCFRTLGV